MTRLIASKRKIIVAAIILIIGMIVKVAVSSGSNYHSITVYYRYLDGTRAYDEYIAVYVDGSSVDITITNPILPGYRAVDSTEVDANPALTTRLQFDDIQEDQVVTVYYAPDSVQYRVRYFFQNVENDLYTEELTLPTWRTDRRGTTGIYPAELENESFEGFTSLFHEPDVIAADGSTVFQIYYDRNYVLMNFDLDGGYGVEPVYAKYDSRFNIPEPKKSGYEFVGWRDSEGTVSKFTSGKVPSDDVTYTAVWEAIETTYTVAYWLENPDDDDYSFQSSKRVTAMSGATVTGIDDWDGELKKYCEFDHADTEVVEGDGSTVVDVYYARKEYTLRFLYARELATANSYINNDLTELVDGEEYYICNDKLKKFLADHRSTGWNNRVALEQQAVKFRFTKVGDNYYIQRTSDNYYFTIGNASSNFVSTPTELIVRRKTVNGSSYWIIQKDSYCINAKGGNPAVGGNDVNGQYGDEDPGSKFFICDEVGSTTSNPQICTLTRDYSNSSSNDLGTRLNAATWSDVQALPNPTGFEHQSVLIGDYLYYYISLTRKYGAYIGNVWPLECMGQASVEGRKVFFGAWNPGKGSYYVNHKNLFGGNNTVKGRHNVMNYMIMLENDTTDTRVMNLLAYWAGAKANNVLAQWVYNLYLPALPGETAVLEKDGVRYKLFGSCTTYDGNRALNEQTPISVTGFTFDHMEQENNPNYEYDNNGVTQSMESYNANLFYTRNSYTLQFQNVGSVEAQYSVPYQTPLSEYNNTPEYPEESQRRYYTFGGWYRTADFIPGTEADLSDEDLKMQDSNLSLYAKWNKVIYSVTFYDDFRDYQNRENEITEVDVEYGEYITTSEIPQSSTLTKPDPNAEFAGWYYYNEEGTKIRFDPYNLPITRDGIALFAEWSSTATGKYKVEYLERGTNRQVADATIGTAFIGKTKTFQAKGGDQLDENHAWVENGENWWPTISSHSILVEPNESEDRYEPNVYQFEYIKKSKVCYTVRYINSETDSAMTGLDAVEKETRYGVVTEDSIYVPGFIADAVTKTLVVAAGDTEEEEYQMNVITFYYHTNTTEALYQVNHYSQQLENLEAYDTYRQDMRICDINKQVDATSSATRIPGFALVPSKTHITGNIENGKGVADGNKLMIDLYYNRLKYGYKVQYLEFGTDEVLETHEFYEDEDEQLMGATVTITAPYEINSSGTDYVRVGNESRTMQIRANNEQNVLNVYYMQRNMYNIKYEAVCIPDLGEDFGVLTRTLEVVNNITLIEGSTAIQSPDNVDRDKYTFIGWFRDPECKIPVPAEMIHDTYTIIPTALIDATYYAGFKRIGGTLKITEEGGNATDHFMYRIYNEKMDMTVSVAGGSTLTINDIPTGTYTVEELSDWSWKYGNVSGVSEQVVVEADQGDNPTEVTFENEFNTLKWLGGENHRNNHFGLINN